MKYIKGGLFKQLKPYGYCNFEIARIFYFSFDPNKELDFKNLICDPKKKLQTELTL